MKNKFLYITILLVTATTLAQDIDTLSVQENTQLVVKDTLQVREPYDPLAPSKAAFYSAVVPGLGQAYNKKYWKIPIVYAGIASGIYFLLRRGMWIFAIPLNLAYSLGDWCTHIVG